MPRRSAAKSGAQFLLSGYKILLALRVSRRAPSERSESGGTILIGAASLSPFTKLMAGTGAVSRYKLSRSQKFITVQDFNCVQMRESGCNGHYLFVLGVGSKAKSVTTCPAQRETTYPYCPCYGPGLIYLSRYQKIVLLYDACLFDYLLVCLGVVIFLA